MSLEGKYYCFFFPDLNIKTSMLSIVGKTVEVVPRISLQVVPGVSVEVVPLDSGQ
ncbi:MAG: hypothetical protein WCK35_28135 [Chloroflexota bacterium]